MKIEEPTPGCRIFTLNNGREYRVIDTKMPYVAGEYPKGGLDVTAAMRSGHYVGITIAPDEECLMNFMRAAERLEPLEKRYAEVDEMEKRRATQFPDH